MTPSAAPSSAPRVVITGMGWVTPLGHDIETVWAKLLQGKSGVDRIKRFDASTFKTDFAAEVKDYDVARFVQDMEPHRHAGYNARFALGAAAQAFKMSGLDRGRLNRRRFGLYLGSGEGTLDWDPYASAHIAGWDQATRKVNGAAWARAAYAGMSPQREIEQEANLTLSHMAWAFGCTGPASNCLTACAASTQAIGEAFELLRRGDADIMFAGGAHTMIHPLGVTGFIRLTALSSRRADPAGASRPFDQTRDGFVMGEGAGMLVMETLDYARARGANILAEVAGYGSSTDAFRITDMHPQGKGPHNAMLGALRQAGINPREPGEDGGGARPPIHYIAAHGTGTKENDRIETSGIKRVFGPQAAQIPISSVKSMMGHLIAAAGVTGVITSVQSIRTGWIVPTINYSVPDAELDLDYVPNHARDLRPQGGVTACLCNSYGFGGQNDCLVIKAFKWV